MLGAAVTLIGFCILAHWWFPMPGIESRQPGAPSDPTAVSLLTPGAPPEAVGPHFIAHSEPALMRLLWPHGSPPAAIVSSPVRHRGADFDVTIRFAQPLGDTPLSLWPHSLVVQSGEVRTLARNDPAGIEWTATIAPQGRRSVDVGLVRRVPCHALASYCSAPLTAATVPGPPVAARVVEPPTHHTAQASIEFLLELSEPVWAGLQELRDRAFQVANGRVSGIDRVDGRHDLFRVTVQAEPGADVAVAFSPRSGCAADERSCAPELSRIVDEFEFSIPAARLYLTFDDGPHPEFTPRVLDVLARYDARATFFVVGSSAAAHPELIDRIVREGHTLANHTWNHDSLAGIEEDEFFDTLASTQELLGEHATACMRPPYYSMDEHTESRAAEMGLKVVMGEIRPRDWTSPGAIEIANRIVGGAAHGRVVILHDGGGERSQTIEGLELALAYLQPFRYVYEPVCES